MDTSTGVLAGLSRGGFLQALISGLPAAGAVAAASVTTGCRSISKNVVEGAIEGAQKKLEDDPETKAKLDQIMGDLARISSDVATITSEGALAAPQARETIEKVKGMLDRNEPDLDRLIRESGQTATNLRRITDILARLAETLERYASHPEELLDLLIYFLATLARKVGEWFVELIAYLLLLMFWNLLRQALAELQRRYWWWRWFPIVIR